LHSGGHKELRNGFQVKQFLYLTDTARIDNPILVLVNRAEFFITRLPGHPAAPKKAQPRFDDAVVTEFAVLLRLFLQRTDSGHHDRLTTGNSFQFYCPNFAQ
jgi:hypothetical protein